MELVRHLPPNRHGRDFVIGDLHGCTCALRWLLREAGFDAARDRLLSVGDLIDRGARSAEAAALLDAPWFHPVRGNHETMLCDVVAGRLPREVWERNGGGWARALPRAALDELARRFAGLPLVLAVGTGAQRYNVLHAEFFGGDAELDAAQFDDATHERLLWGRQLIRAPAEAALRVQEGLSPTYCGHTPVPHVTRRGAQIYIDTGAFMEQGKLTLFEIGRGRAYEASEQQAERAGAAELPYPTAVP